MRVTQPSLDHAQHDALLIAQLATDDATSSERVRAKALIAECPDCAELFQDLQALQLATAALPVPVRRRDFRLTEADAARIRRSGRLGWLDSGWRAWVQWLAGPRFAFGQQLGTGLAALGVAGLLLATVPGLLGLGAVTTVLSTAGAPIGPSRISTEAPTDQGTTKSGADAAQPAASNPSTESIAGSQPPSRSAAGVAAPQSGPSLSVLGGPSAAPPAAAAAPTAAPTGAASAALLPAPTAAPTAVVPTAASAGPATAAPSAAPTTPPTIAPIRAATAAPEATISRVPQGVASSSGTPAPPPGGGLPPLVLASIVLFLVGLGLLLARRMAVALTDR